MNVLQQNIGAVSNNLLVAYKKMAESMENNLKMMSNMNKMMECFVLQHIDASCSWGCRSCSSSIDFSQHGRPICPRCACYQQVELSAEEDPTPRLI